MPPATEELTSNAFAVDEARNTIRFERRVPTGPEAVFAAWTDPEQLRRWWDPAGTPLAKCEIDLRVGGGFTFVTVAHPDMPFAGVYRTIERPTLLVFDAMGAEGRVRLNAIPDGTRMVVEIICSSPEHLQQFVQMGVAAGTSQTLDNLVAFKAG